jgi:multidrug efflux pump subunit AcrA (membrane-fusion protein)
METLMRTPTKWIILAVIPAFLLLAACRQRGGAEAAHQAGEDDHDHEAGPVSSVTLTAEAMAAAHITTVRAERRVLSRRITAPGELEFNARRLAHLTARTAGRVERLLAVEGDRVREGQVLAEVYSPDYMAIQAEYLQASARAKRQAGDPAEAGTARALLESAGERLLLVGASPADVDALAASPVPRPFLPIRATLTGTVLGSGVLPGDHVDLGASLFRLADLTTLWACLHIQEKDLSAAKPGVVVALRTQAYPGEEFRGPLVLIGDLVEPGTRTVEGRVEVPNPAGKLKPGMYVEAFFAASGEREALVVPEASVQDDEGRPIVFVKTGERTFARREVVTGERASGAVEIAGGLAEGETVVVSGSFLLESELRKGSMKDEHGHR